MQYKKKQIENERLPEKFTIIFLYFGSYFFLMT